MHGALSLDLDFEDVQHAVADSVMQLCRDRCDRETVKAATSRFPVELWRDLAELGVLSAATPEGDGGALEITAAMEALGQAVFPGPLAATFLATQVLPERERAEIATGGCLVSVGSAGIMPWAPLAEIFLDVEGDRIWMAHPRGPVEAIGTLGGEPWARVELERERELPESRRGLVLHDLALAAYLAGAAQKLIADASEYARTRTQFGRPIGEFQAVAHPLADCAIGQASAATLARGAAFHFDRTEEDARGWAAAARLSASRVAVNAAHVCHQVFGAVGITLEGPVYHVSRRIRQLASQPPISESCRVAVRELFGFDEGEER